MKIFNRGFIVAMAITSSLSFAQTQKPEVNENKKPSTSVSDKAENSESNNNLSKRPVLNLSKDIDLGLSNRVELPQRYSDFARGGHTGGNGGHSVASQFTRIAKNIASLWQDICKDDSSDVHCNYLYDFKNSLDKYTNSYVKVRATENKNEVMAYDGFPREAINNGLNNIVVYVKGWNSIPKTELGKIRKIKLVLHEYFTIIGIDASDYFEYSEEIFGLLVRKGYQLDVMLDQIGLPAQRSINLKIYKGVKKILITEKLKALGFSVEDSTEHTRYNLKVTASCNSFKCYFQYTMQDNFKNTLKKSGVYTDNYVVRKKLTLEELTIKVLELDFPTYLK